MRFSAAHFCFADFRRIGALLGDFISAVFCGGFASIRRRTSSNCPLSTFISQLPQWLEFSPFFLAQFLPGDPVNILKDAVLREPDWPDISGNRTHIRGPIDVKHALGLSHNDPFNGHVSKLSANNSFIHKDLTSSLPRDYKKTRTRANFVRPG
ncbi:hypothetical protein SBA5_450115 [Candidatus Sulfotelmatomonas gaucii]|uniref:Uncharacterized protein n=1 Tax=Candidatus Sulfuritelmatomonas gaucii TaxID=2043161 RepID=A0A2N9LN64_9BACT|nr:hypothetical protein SBA5_450115 [Candidatus Sulfotelmatomonas gaucii]